MDAKAIEMLVTNLPDDYEEICIMEARAAIELQEAKDALEYEKARLSIEARHAGYVNGKNADERAEQIIIGLDGCPGIYWLSRYVKAKEIDLAGMTAGRKSMEMRSGLLKAWLYSQSGKE